MNITLIKRITNRDLKEAESIIVFFMSIIGPKIKKAKTDVEENVLLNVEAIKASASEQRDNTKAINIIIRIDRMELSETALSKFFGTKVCMEAAMNAPKIKKRPTSINSPEVWAMICKN